MTISVGILNSAKQIQVPCFCKLVLDVWWLSSWWWGKSKVVQAPCHEGVLGEWRYSPTQSLTSVLDGGEWSASRPSCLTPRERAPNTHWIGGWVGPRANLDMVLKRKIPSSLWESNPCHPTVQPIASCYTYWAVLAHHLGDDAWKKFLCHTSFHLEHLVKYSVSLGKIKIDDGISTMYSLPVPYH
jgi:hypothetical protein